MTFQPVIVGSGLVGWQFLNATRDTQEKAFNSSFSVQRDSDYFLENIGNIETAEELVGDRRLLRVALSAFGLQDDIDNKFFIQKVLEDGVLEQDALANRLADDRYKDFSRAFRFDAEFAPATISAGFGQEIVDKFLAQEFEVAVGNQNESLRLSLNFQRGLPDIAESTGGDDTKWFRVMGTPPLRTVFETALGLPSGFGQLDIDKQLEVFRDKMQSRFGVSEINDIANEDVMNDVVQSYLLQTQVQELSATGSSQIALSLLQSIPTPAAFT